MAYSTIYFFIGTTAELIKMMPVMRACARRGIEFQLLASGQNDIERSELLKYCEKQAPDLVLFRGQIKKSALGLLWWFVRTFCSAFWQLRPLFRRHRRGEAVLVVHGDTVSTVMGALLGRLHGLDVAHVEAGLRSFDYFHPFPEEIDRVITSRLATLHFCPNGWAVGNLQKRRGDKIDTGHNTLLDALALAQAEAEPSPRLAPLRDEPYFVFVLHRQENLFDDQLVRDLVGRAIAQSRWMRCVFILHHLTEVHLRRLNLLEVLREQPNITLFERLPYIEFMQLLAGADHVVTDGGSNQEECYYLGKPCLVLRNVTERTEGLEHNVVLSRLDPAVIDAFLAEPGRYARPPIRVDERPSDIIAARLGGEVAHRAGAPGREQLAVGQS
ncbi:UDP-N-acetylglucosamine 2-epimerase [Chitinimonas lacunae]|uniref:UDP-N-acetylglucosamine 2-epimerase n=1 Tax=Chitinimonas lacunae TaxID=1963018 RepID=A0ABV8MWQ2_9NEIS